jgi:uridine phosphorylase
MPQRLRPSAPVAAAAVLVGDPGRALMLAQELLEEPKMSNHARGLWGYTGRTAAGDELTIQATGMGGPSAALVLADLAKLGVRRVVRVGTCTDVAGRSGLGELLPVAEALAVAGSTTAFGLDVGDTVTPDRELLERLERALGEDARTAIVASLDTAAGNANELPDTVAVADMQTAAVFARARELGIAAAAILIVSEKGNDRLGDEALEMAAKRAGQVAMKGLKANPQVES